MINVKREVPSVLPEVVERLSKHSVATIHEAMNRRGALDPSIKPIAKGMKVCGSALTVKSYPGDNLMLIKAISMAKRGDVIVCEMGMKDCGPFGEVLAVECISKGIGGLVISSGVRDSIEIIERGFPVFSSGLCVRGTSKSTLGYINHPVSLGNEIVNPCDLILGDDDGVVVVPRLEVEKVILSADSRVEKEGVVIKRLQGGESLFDIYGYQKVFDKLGCIEE